jgi:hypothetical protein
VSWLVGSVSCGAPRLCPLGTSATISLISPRMIMMMFMIIVKNVQQLLKSLAW